MNDRHTRTEHTRVFWTKDPIGSVLSVAHLEANTIELTEDIAGDGSIQGFSPRTVTRNIRGVGAYIASHEYTDGSLRLYDLTEGGGPIRLSFDVDSVNRGTIVFLWDAVNGMGGDGGRGSVFQAATMGPVDDEFASNAAATFSLQFAIECKPEHLKAVLP